MTAKRINMTIDEEILIDLDAKAESLNMSRSECIAFMFEILGELNAWNALEAVAMEGAEEHYTMPTKRQLVKAARKCSVCRD